MTRTVVKVFSSRRVKTTPRYGSVSEKQVKNGETLDDIVIKALSSPERKNILRIVGGYSDGVNYTGILGETGLSTGRLNYHLGELDGFLTRDEERRYSLTELGRKAVAVLDFIHSDIDQSVLPSLNTRKVDRLKGISRRLNAGFIVASLILVSILVLMGYLSVVEQDSVLAVFTGFWAVFTLGMIYLMDRSRRRDPERILWLLDWLEWKLLGGYKRRTS